MWLQQTNKQKIHFIYFNWLKINKLTFYKNLNWLIVEARQATTYSVSRWTDYLGLYGTHSEKLSVNPGNLHCMSYCSFVYIVTPFLLVSHSFLLVAFSSHLWRFQLTLQLISEDLSAPSQNCCVSWDPLMHLLAEKRFMKSSYSRFWIPILS